MKEFLNRFVRARTVGYFIVDRNRDTSCVYSMWPTTVRRRMVWPNPRREHFPNVYGDSLQMQIASFMNKLIMPPGWTLSVVRLLSVPYFISRMFCIICVGVYVIWNLCNNFVRV